VVFQGSRAKKYFLYFKTDNDEKTNFQPFEAGSDNTSMAKVRGDNTLKLFQFIKVLSGVIPKSFKISVMLVKNNPAFKITPSP
jgi:hypothetical protein